MKKLVFLVALLCCSTQAMAADLCEGLDNKSLVIHGNGYAFTVAPGGISLNLQNGVYTFDTVTNAGEPVRGQCKDRHITFKRTLQGNIPQYYDGWIFEKASLMMAGTFAHNSTQHRYGWCAEMEFIIK